MIPEEVRTRIRSLFFAEHWPVGTIAANLGVHHETVEGAIESHRFINQATRLCRSQLDPYKPFVQETLEQYPKLRAKRLLRMIRDRGYQGGYGILCKHVRRVRKTLQREAFLRLHVLPGEQAQVDWGSFGHVRIGHALRALSCFVMVLSYCRALFAYFFLDQTLESFLEGHARAFAHLGGAARVCLYDNLKSVVLERVGDHVRFHPRLLELAGHYHFIPRPCAPYRGNEKGRVERAVRYIRDSFFAARRFRDVDDLNRQLAAWIADTADLRKVPGDPDDTLVRDALERERTCLLPLPEHPFPTEHVAAVASGKQPYVRFDRNDYSIPHALVRTPLTLVASRTEVRFLDGTTEVARHARSWDARLTIEDPTHFEGLAAQKRHARESRGRDLLRSLCPSAEGFFETLALRGDSLARPAVRLGQLLDQYGHAALEQALAEAIARGSVSAESVAHLLAQHARAAGTAPIATIPLPDDPRVRDLRVVPHALGPYDRLSEPESPPVPEKEESHG